MPYRSEAQRRYFHTAAARRAGISAATVAEFDNASRGKKLPARRGKKMKMKPKGVGMKRSHRESAARLAAARASRKKSGSKVQRHYAASMAAGRG